MILEITLPIPRALVFDYLPPKGTEGLSPDEFLGRRVKIPFGFRSAVGVVVKVKDTTDTPPEKIKTAYELLDSEPLLSENMRDLGAEVIYEKHYSGFHGFEMASDNARTREILDATMAFMKDHSGL